MDSKRLGRGRVEAGGGGGDALDIRVSGPC